MPGFDGTGPSGMGPMTGGGRGFCVVSPPVNQPMYLPGAVFTSYGIPFASQMTREQEIGFLKTQAQAMREQLKYIDDQIRQLEDEA